MIVSLPRFAVDVDTGGVGRRIHRIRRSGEREVFRFGERDRVRTIRESAGLVTAVGDGDAARQGRDVDRVAVGAPFAADDRVVAKAVGHNKRVSVVTPRKAVVIHGTGGRFGRREYLGRVKVPVVREDAEVLEIATRIGDLDIVVAGIGPRVDAGVHFLEHDFVRAHVEVADRQRAGLICGLDPHIVGDTVTVAGTCAVVEADGCIVAVARNEAVIICARAAGKVGVGVHGAPADGSACGRAAQDRVIARAPLDRVRSRIAIDRICASTAVDGIVAAGDLVAVAVGVAEAHAVVAAGAVDRKAWCSRWRH